MSYSRILRGTTLSALWPLTKKARKHVNGMEEGQEGERAQKSHEGGQEGKRARKLREGGDKKPTRFLISANF